MWGGVLVLVAEQEKGDWMQEGGKTYSRISRIVFGSLYRENSET